MKKEIVPSPVEDRYKNSNIGQLPTYFFDEHWVHNFEIDRDGYQFYRPTSTYSPAPARFRNQLQFKNDNNCHYLQLAHNDAHQMRDASWAYFSNVLTILRNKVDIIDAYELIAVSDTLLTLKKKNAPMDIVFGKWKLLNSGKQNMVGQNYFLSLGGNEFEIYRGRNLIHSSKMSHSPWRLQEPLALSFDEDIVTNFTWLESGHYTIQNDTLMIEISDHVNSIFIRDSNNN